MKYSDYLRNLFSGITLYVEDLFLLEGFQIEYLPDRLPKKEFSFLLKSYPEIKSFLILKYPPIRDYIRSLPEINDTSTDADAIQAFCQEVIWEIGELIVYNKYPGFYEERVQLKWDISDIESITPLKDKVVVDAGAGTGRLSFMTAPYVKSVFAVEPVTALRNFMREKAKKENIENVFIMDGFLHSIPLPKHTADVLVTSNAIGWDLTKELPEIERVVKSKGWAIHLAHAFDAEESNPFHEVLISPEYNYSFDVRKDEEGVRWRYYKNIG